MDQEDLASIEVAERRTKHVQDHASLIEMELRNIHAICYLVRDGTYDHISKKEIADKIEKHIRKMGF